MLSLGLTAARQAEFTRTLATGYELKVTVQILNPEHGVIRTVSEVLLDGQIDVTAPKMSAGDVEVSRTASLTFLDPTRSLALDSGSPSDGAFYMDRMVRVVYSVRCSFGWVDVPVFTGPVVKVDRDGDLVDVECQGKERYALGAAWNADTFKGRKGDVMTAMMRKTGEITRYLNFPATKQTVSKEVSVGKESTFWSHVWRVNSSMNRILYYDGRGICQSRSKPNMTKVAVKVSTGTGGLIVEPPQISYSIEGMKNAVRVQGSKPSKGKAVPFAKVVAPASSPLALIRRTSRTYMAEFVDNPDLKSTAACRSLAKDLLDDYLMQSVETTVATLPIPHLEPWDVVQVVTDKTSVMIRANAFTLPLVQSGGTGTPMTIGALTNVRKPRRKIRRA